LRESGAGKQSAGPAAGLRPGGLTQFPERFGYGVEEAVELFARAGEGRAELQGVTPETDIETLAPQLEACFERADGRVALTRRQLDGTAQTAISYVDDMGTALLHAVQSLLEVRNDFGGTVNQAVAVEQVERGNAGCAGHRVG